MSETNTRSADAEDAEIGARIRTIRSAKAMTQEDLGDKLGISFQQIQKYERGTNRVTATRLRKIAVALGCTVGDLLDEAAGGEASVLLPTQVMRLANRIAVMPDARRAAVLNAVSKVVDAFDDAPSAA